MILLSYYIFNTDTANYLDWVLSKSDVLQIKYSQCKVIE